MENREENLIVHEMGKNITELAIRSANGNTYSVYQKRLFGVDAGG